MMNVVSLIVVAAAKHAKKTFKRLRSFFDSISELKMTIMAVLIKLKRWVVLFFPRFIVSTRKRASFYPGPVS
jgi:hypothetical protein